MDSRVNRGRTQREATRPFLLPPQGSDAAASPTRRSLTRASMLRAVIVGLVVPSFPNLLQMCNGWKLSFSRKDLQVFSLSSSLQENLSALIMLGHVLAVPRASVDIPETEPCVLRSRCAPSAPRQAQGSHAARVFTIKERMGKNVKRRGC